MAIVSIVSEQASYDQRDISFDDRPGQTLQRWYGNRKDIVKSSRPLLEITRCQCNVLVGSLRLSQEPTIIFGRK